MDNMAMDSVTRQLMKELKFTRIICMILSVLTLCLLAGGLFLYGKVRKLAEICEPVVEQVSQLNVESLNKTLEHVNVSMETVDWQQVSDVLGELDVDALNSAIEGLDTEEISKSLKNLNDAADRIREVSENLSSLAQWLVGLFHNGQ